MMKVECNLLIGSDRWSNPEEMAHVLERQARLAMMLSRQYPNLSDENRELIKELYVMLTNIAKLILKTDYELCEINDEYRDVLMQNLKKSVCDLREVNESEMYTHPNADGAFVLNGVFNALDALEALDQEWNQRDQESDT